MENVIIYDRDMAVLSILDNATAIGYELKHNDLWTGTFSLPADDPKNAYCAARNLVRLPGGGRDLGIFRIRAIPSAEVTAMGGMITYQLEHVMATLFDDVLFGYHEVGGTGISTADVISYILGKQTVVRWQLGTCAFTDYYQYHFENVTLLNALMSLGECLTEEYTWEFDTNTTPWTVSLRRADGEAGCGIYYGRGLQGIEKAMDASALVTRLYPLGYGEGVNQLTIKSVNNGIPYLDADTAGTWGVVSNVWTDTRIEDAALLKARAQQVLEGYKNPYITYKASAIDLYHLTGESWDDYMPGKLVRVLDDEHGVSLEARIVNVSKQDLLGDPGQVEITIANSPRDAADLVSTLADKTAIGEMYSQGATNLFAQSFADNADGNHPATFRVYIPTGLVRINQMLLSWQTRAFRAYSTGAASGGGGARTSDGGGAVVATTQAQGAYTITEPAKSRTATGSFSASDNTGYAEGPGSHRHSFSLSNVPISLSFTIPAMEIDVPAHDHSVSIPSHTHSVSIPDHTHDIVYGIYEGGQANSVTVRVDGTEVPAAALSRNEVDVSAWMSADESGRISRGTWHTIEIVPNTLTRIEATLYAQCFIQSTGGGDY